MWHSPVVLREESEPADSRETAAGLSTGLPRWTPAGHDVRLPRARTPEMLRLVNHLVVFARWPEPGKVKTRLSPALPPALACELHEGMLLDVLEAGRVALADRRYLYWAGAPTDRPWSRAAREAGYTETLQRGRDLGARLEQMFEELLGGPDDRVVVVGTDCPELSTTVMNAAFIQLSVRDLVLGPTPDGGYYLLGLSRRAPEILRDVSWGSDQVLAQTLERARATGLTTAVLEPLADVDTPADLVGLVTRCLALARGAPRHAAETLQRMGLLPAFPA